GEQFARSRLGRLAFEEPANRFGDRHGYAVALGECDEDRSGVRTFGYRAAIAHQGSRILPLAERFAQREVAARCRGTRQHEVAEPAKPGERGALRAERIAEALHLGIAARDQRGTRVLAELKTLDDAAGNREHVLDRAAHLGA